jgi:hypothetical protein
MQPFTLTRPADIEPSPSMGEGLGEGDRAAPRTPHAITPSQPSPIEGEGFRHAWPGCRDD